MTKNTPGQTMQRHSAADRSVMNGFENRLAVWKFFSHNPCHNQRECAEALGLSHKTVARHAQAIKQGWRPPLIYFTERCRDFVSAPDGDVVSVGVGANRFRTDIRTKPDANPEDGAAFVSRVIASVFVRVHNHG